VLTQVSEHLWAVVFEFELPWKLLSEEETHEIRSMQLCCNIPHTVSDQQRELAKVTLELPVLHYIYIKEMCLSFSLLLAVQV